MKLRLIRFFSSYSNGLNDKFQAELAKSKGTERLKDQKFDLAIKHYNRVISLLDHQETKVGIKLFENKLV